MTENWVAAFIALIITAILGVGLTMSVLESLHEWRMEELQWDCRPKVCRTEQGHRKECDNEESNR